MQLQRLLHLSAFVAAPLLVAPRVSELQFAVSEGTTVRYTFSQSLMLDVEEVEMMVTVNGEEHPGEDMSELELTINEDEEIVFVDSYLKVDDSSPVQISRSYESMSSVGTQDGTDPSGEPISEEENKSSELEGQTVMFSWDDEEEEWSMAFAEDSEGDEELLEGLEAEVFFLGLLPESEVDEGDTWEIEPRAFLEATNPGGDMPWDEDEEEDEEGGDTEEQMLDNLEGTVTAEFVGLAEEDGAELATIRFTASLTSEFDEEEEQSEETGEMGMEVEAVTTMSFEIELEGEMIWDMGAGRIRSLSLSGPIRLDQDMNQSSENAEFSFEMNMHQGMVGKLEIEVATE